MIFELNPYSIIFLSFAITITILYNIVRMKVYSYEASD